MLRLLAPLLAAALLQPPPLAAAQRVRRACSDPESRGYKFCDTSLTPHERAADIVSRLHVTEKPALMTARHSAPVDRLGIPAYDWGVNSIHGDQVSCGKHCATNYPLPVAIGASMNMSLVYSLANMMGVELRALRLEGACEDHRRRLADGDGGAAEEAEELQDACIGLDTWAPNINLNRDPRASFSAPRTLSPCPPQTVIHPDAQAGVGTGRSRRSAPSSAGRSARHTPKASRQGRAKTAASTCWA